MADTIAVMNDGRIEQAGGAADLYERPRTEFVANFLGVSNLIDGKLGATQGSLAAVETHDGARLHVPADRVGPHDTDSIRVGVRPEKITLARPPTARARGRGELAARDRRRRRLPRHLDPVRGRRRAARSSPSSRRTSTAPSRTPSGPAARSA